MNRLRQLISIRNLRARRAPKRGQIAILMLLGITGILIFALATANLGVATKTATKLANAADGAALDLGSQLATKANMLFHSLGDKTEQCTPTGVLATFLAVVVAVVSLITFQPEGLLLAMAIAGAAGAAGGAIGGAIAGTGALQGAIQGAIIGASIAAGAEFFQGIGAGFAGPEGALVPVADFGSAIGETALANVAVPAFGSISGATSGLVTGATVMSGATPLLAGSTLAGAGAIAGGTLGAASNIYNAVVKQQATTAGFAAAAKALSGLPDYERWREGAFFQALTQAVDDPNQVADVHDSDEDGDRAELVPAFQSWWAKHIHDLKALVEPGMRDSAARLRDFVQVSLGPFAGQARAFLPQLDRRDVECGAGGCDPVDGQAVGLWRDLRDQRRPVGFWQPGPDRGALFTWYLSPATACGDRDNCDGYPPGYDVVDSTHLEYEQLIDAATALLGEDLLASESELSALARSYHDWINLFYDPASDVEFFDGFRRVADAIEEWIAETERVRASLPGCRLTYTDEPYAVADILPRGAGNECGPTSHRTETPFQQCVWQKPSEQRFGTRVSGPDAAQSACRIYTPDDQNRLNGQVGIARTAAQNLHGYIEGTLSCPSGGTIGSVSVTDIRARLENNNLYYAFDATYTCTREYACRDCVPKKCDDPDVKDCGDDCTPSTCTETSNQSIVDGEGVQPNIGAPDLTVLHERALPLLPIHRFNAALDNFQARLIGLDRDSQGKFATTDLDLTDEFYHVIEGSEERRGLRPQVNQIRLFLAALERLVRDMQNVQRNEHLATNGAGFLEYPWEDVQGGGRVRHAVTVKTGPFIMPEIREESRGNPLIGEDCLVLDPHNDGNAWVRITRNDLQDRQGAGGVGSFWRWNSGTTRKCASASYGHDSVGLHPHCP